MAYTQSYSTWVPGAPATEDHLVASGVPTSLDSQNSPTLGDSSRRIRQFAEILDNIQQWIDQGITLATRDYLVTWDGATAVGTFLRTRTTVSSGANFGAVTNAVMLHASLLGPAGSQSLGTPGASVQLANIGPDNTAVPILATDYIGKPTLAGTTGVLDSSVTANKTFTQTGVDFTGLAGRAIVISLGNGTKDLYTKIATVVSATVITLQDAGTNASGLAWCLPITYGIALYGQGPASRGQGNNHPDDGSLMLQASGAGWNTGTNGHAVLDFRNAGSWTVNGHGTENFGMFDLSVSAGGLAEYAVVGRGIGTGNAARSNGLTVQGGTIANLGIGNHSDTGASSDWLLTNFISSQPATNAAWGMEVNISDIIVVDDFNIATNTRALLLQGGGVCMIGRGHMGGGSGGGDIIKVTSVSQCEIGAGVYIDNIQPTNAQITTVRVESNGQNVNALTSGQLRIASTGGLDATGTLVVATASGPRWVAYTSIVNGTTVGGCTCSQSGVVATGGAVTMLVAGIHVAPSGNNTVQNLVIHPDTRFNMNDPTVAAVWLDGGGGSGFTGNGAVRIGGMTNGVTAGGPVPAFVHTGNGWRMQSGTHIDHVSARAMTALWDNDGTTANYLPDHVGDDISITASGTGATTRGTARITGTLNASGVLTVAHKCYAAPTHLIPGANASLAGRLYVTADATNVVVTSTSGATDSGVAVSVIAKVLLS